MKPGKSFIYQPVRSLQHMLRVISKEDSRVPIIVPDGIFGPTTMRVVSAFQRIYGFPATGFVDQIVWEKIVATQNELC